MADIKKLIMVIVNMNGSNLIFSKIKQQSVIFLSESQWLINFRLGTAS